MLDKFEAKELVTTFDETSKEETVSITITDKTVKLSATEANDLLEWLYQRRDTFFRLSVGLS
jgi:hypothetical protein